MSDTETFDKTSTGRVRIKVCGVTSTADAKAAADAGVDAIGLMFAARSKRCVTPVQAAEIAATVPPFISRVALFVDNEAEEIERILATVAIDMIQFHGSESPTFCSRFATPYIKAVPMGEPGVSLADWAGRYPDARAFLLDANRVGEYGGAGRTFDWSRGIESVDRPIVVAGGLRVHNVKQAIDRFSPYAVDVSSGVETRPGVKSGELMRAFVDAVTKGNDS